MHSFSSVSAKGGYPTINVKVFNNEINSYRSASYKSDQTTVSGAVRLSTLATHLTSGQPGSVVIFTGHSGGLGTGGLLRR